MFVCLFVCLFVCIHVCTYVCMYVCIYVCRTFACLHFPCVLLPAFSIKVRLRKGRHVCMYTCGCTVHVWTVPGPRGFVNPCVMIVDRALIECSLTSYPRIDDDDAPHSHCSPATPGGHGVVRPRCVPIHVRCCDDGLLRCVHCLSSLLQ